MIQIGVQSYRIITRWSPQNVNDWLQIIPQFQLVKILHYTDDLDLILGKHKELVQCIRRVIKSKQFRNFFINQNIRSSIIRIIPVVIPSV